MYLKIYTCSDIEDEEKIVFENRNKLRDTPVMVALLVFGITFDLAYFTKTAEIWFWHVDLHWSCLGLIEKSLVGGGGEGRGGEGGVVKLSRGQINWDTGFPTDPLKLGLTASLFIAISKNKKQQHQWRFHENRMKNDKVMTVFLLPDVIFWLISNRSGKKWECILLYFLKEWYSYPKKVIKNFSDRPTSSKMTWKSVTRLIFLGLTWHLALPC